ncbi:hypothetical protein GPECTOR_548g558 [Gonium pectorale]|uniref:Uncharacterized protein n=1 Tax=Gonium pectorale TaxID=33097 RepID=A0A150FUS5_GONPE|nr:hypothetical protein GPECTOR_548g558 [Gonium pectorale]|eukprot:KXZ41328.1 hypothetical protein GPECTOR_548g558 [Gonium pectorale]
MQAEALELQQQLVAELRASGLLEHLARLLLTLLASSPPPALGMLVERLPSWFGSLCHVCHKHCSCVLSCLLPVSPCLSYFVSCSLVSACADLERGPGCSLYGMPPAHWLRRRAGDPEVFRPNLGFLDAWECAVKAERERLVAVLVGEAGEVASTSHTSLAGRSLRSLYRRELSLLTRQELEREAAPHPASEGQGGGGGSQVAAGVCLPPAAQLSLPLATAAADEVEAARQRLELSGVPPLNTAATFEVCMRLAEVATAEALKGAGGQSGQVRHSGSGPHEMAAAAGFSSREPWGWPYSHCGPAGQPSADVAAALTAGYLPCLTAYLRAALRPGAGALTQSANGILSIQACAWIQLLAFGDTPEAVSLVAAGSGGSTGRPGFAAAGGTLSGAACERLAAVASVVLARLLPEMARLLRGLLRLQRHVQPDTAKKVAALLSLMAWPAAALAQCAGAQGGAGLPAGAGGDGGRGGSGACDDAASWRQLLLVELRLPALLGTALHMLQESAGRPVGRGGM